MVSRRKMSGFFEGDFIKHGCFFVSMVIDVLEKMKKEMLRRRYSVRTIKTYRECVKRFLRSNHKDVRKYSKKDILEFLEKLADKGASGSTINVYLQALKFMIEYALNKRVWVDIRYSKTDRKRLPEVLSKEEVLRLFGVIRNPKHLLMVKLMYSTGFRVSELLDLRVRDLKLSRGYGWVRKGKGNKDRLFVIAKCLNKEIEEWVCEKMPDELVFKGHRGRLSVRTVQEVVKKSAKNAKIRKNVHPHTLRHSFATHMIENGYPVNSVQSLLGHNSPDTTMIYVHIQTPQMINVESPLDMLNAGV